MDEGGELAALLPRTIAQLDKQMPRAWSHANPVDIVGDADGARYAAAVDALADDRGVGAVLAMNVPTALTSPVEAARAVTGAPGAKVVPLIGCWIGGPDAEAGRKVLHDAGIPAYDTPLRAVRGFMHIVQYRRGQRALQRTPPSIPEARSDTQLVRAIVHGALAEKREHPDRARGQARAGGLRHSRRADRGRARCRRGGGSGDAHRLSRRGEGPVARDHATRATSAAWRSTSAPSRRCATPCAAMTDKVCTAAPGARIDGFVVQPMIKRPHAVELILGAAEDPVFGPILLVGHGGVAAEVIDDKALALPPLDPVLAEDALSRTRVDRLLRGYRDRPPAARGAVCDAMVRLSQLIADVGEIAELDINPLLVDAEGVIALDARIVVRKPARTGARRALCHPALSGRARNRDHASRRAAAHPADPARRRAADPGLRQENDAGRHAHALLRAVARAQPRDGGAPDADRLRPRDGLPAARRQGAAWASAGSPPIPASSRRSSR